MAMSGPAKTVTQTVSLVLVMGALAWASVPFYDWFCRVTGFGGVPGVSETASEDVLDQTITIRFDGSLNNQMPWTFKPLVSEMDIRIGETGLAFYEAYNPTGRPVAGQASYNVTPYTAGGFFNKIDCFCFTEQVLEPGERVQMPVTVYVDPEIVTDRDGKYVHTITLSYTFYEIDLPESYANAGQIADQKTKTN
ncbi:MAG: cytochrome c oxidase assembly protein [Sulfitobacter sp.]